MTLFIQNDAVGAGAGAVNANLAFTHLSAIANLDTGLGLGALTGNLQAVTYAQTAVGPCPNRLNTLVNTNFGINPAGTDIIVLAVGANFTLGDGTPIINVGGTALPPAGSGQPGANLNGTASCLVIYDTSDRGGQGYCVARNGTGGDLDLPLSVSVIAYHELSHAFRIVTNALLALTAACDPSSPEENAAITDENDMRTQLAALLGDPVVLRDPGIHCAGDGCRSDSCCIVASVASGSPLSAEVAQLRSLRDDLLRRDEIGFAFFDALLYAYYAFSPQVCTVMAGDPALRETVLHGVVRPLIRMLRLVRTATVDGGDHAALAARFRSDLADGTDARATLAVLDGAGELIGLGPARSGPVGAAQSAAALVADRALPDEHVSWGLVEPIRRYHDLLRAWAEGAAADQIAAVMAEWVEDWAARLPLTPAWGSMSVEGVTAELAVLDAVLLRTARSRQVFRDRLLARFDEVTAVRAAVEAQLTEVER